MPADSLDAMLHRECVALFPHALFGDAGGLDFDHGSPFMALADMRSRRARSDRPSRSF